MRSSSEVYQYSRNDSDDFLFGSDNVLLERLHTFDFPVVQNDSVFNLSDHQYKVDFDITLGSGSSATVYLGYLYQEQKEIKVAVKKSKIDDVEGLKREHEILKEISKQINALAKEYEKANKKNDISACILEYYGSNIHHSLYALSRVELIMEYVNSGTLGDWIYPHCTSKAHKPFNWTIAYNILVHIIKALDFLNNIMKLIHCDVKAHNILLHDEDHMMQGKLGDFGSCQPLGKAELPLGTILYHAPEVLKGLEQTPQSDIFSFGCMIAEMSNQKVLYKDLGKCFNSPCMVKKHVAEDGLRDTIRSETPDKMCHLYFICTMAKPEHRPDHASILKELELGRNALSAGSSVLKIT